MEHASNQLWLEIVVTLVGIAWTFFKTTEWYKNNVSQPKREKALEAVQAGVREVYETYTKAIKEASADGTLTAEEAKEARARAKEAAIAYGKEHGVDTVKIIGEAFMDLYLERAHKEINVEVSSSGGKTDATSAPAPVAPAAPAA